MRVLVVHNRYRSSQPSGENSVVDSELEILREAGIDVRSFQVESDDISGWSPAKRALLPMRVVWSRSGAHQVAHAIARERPDVVHFHNLFPLLSPAALRAASKSSARVVQTLHNFRPLCAAGTLYRDGHVCHDCVGHAPLPAVKHGCYRGSSAATLPVAAMGMVNTAARGWRWADTLVTPSRFARDVYVEAGWPAERFAVKYNTVADREQIRSGPGEGFVCLARLAPEKGVEVLLRAWAIAFPDGDQRLTIAGSGELERSLRELSAGMKGVQFAGHVSVDAAMSLVAGSRALVVPSLWYELFPRTIVEAYSMGVPVLASRIGSLIELVRNDRTGLQFEPGDVDSLAAALRRLAEDSDMSQRLGTGARRAYTLTLTPASTASQLLAIYRNAQSGAAPAPAEQLVVV